MITFNTTRRLTPIDMYTQHTLKHTQTEAFACFVWKSFSNAPRKRKWKLACCGLKKCISCAHSTSYNTLLILILISSKINRNARGTLFDWIMFGALFFFVLLHLFAVSCFFSFRSQRRTSNGWPKKCERKPILEHRDWNFSAFCTVRLDFARSFVFEYNSSWLGKW